MTKQGACRSGNSDGWPMKILKLASSENTDPALILKKVQLCKDLMEYLLLTLGSREKIYITYVKAFQPEQSLRCEECLCDVKEVTSHQERRLEL